MIRVRCDGCGEEQKNGGAIVGLFHRGCRSVHGNANAPHTWRPVLDTKPEEEKCWGVWCVTRESWQCSSIAGEDCPLIGSDELVSYRAAKRLLALCRSNGDGATFEMARRDPANPDAPPAEEPRFDARTMLKEPAKDVFVASAKMHGVPPTPCTLPHFCTSEQLNAKVVALAARCEAAEEAARRYETALGQTCAELWLMRNESEGLALDLVRAQRRRG